MSSVQHHRALRRPLVAATFLPLVPPVRTALPLVPPVRTALPLVPPVRTALPLVPAARTIRPLVPPPGLRRTALPLVPPPVGVGGFMMDCGIGAGAGGGAATRARRLVDVASSDELESLPPVLKTLLLRPPGPPPYVESLPAGIECIGTFIGVVI